MRRLWVIATVLATGCGGGDGDPDATEDARPRSDDGDPGVDAAPACSDDTQPTAPFVRHAGNPVYLPGETFTDGLFDVVGADPDVRWDDDAGRWRIYWMGPHGSTFVGPHTQLIRAVESTDGLTMTVRDQPALVAASDPAAWDSVNTETPSVAYNPDAPPGRRYLLLYAGARDKLGTFPFPEYGIGAAFSADGLTFTRIAAAESPHDQAGLVLTAEQVFGTDGVVADPEVVYADGQYHLWFSSFSCDGAGCANILAFGISYATSTDGVSWTVRGDSPLPTLLRTPGVRQSGGSQPSVVWDAERCQWEMWMTHDAGGENAAQPVVFNNSPGFHHATSEDGISWSFDPAMRDLAWDAAAPGEAMGLLTGADVAARGRERRMLYVGFHDQDVPAGFLLPVRDDPDTPDVETVVSGVMALSIAVRQE